MATDSNSATPPKAAPTAAPAKPAPQATVKPAAPAAPAASAAKSLKEQSRFGARAEFASMDFVKVAPMIPDTVQYDPSYPEVVVRSADGDIVPMTPFISQRIGKTLKLIV